MTKNEVVKLERCYKAKRIDNIQCSQNSHYTNKCSLLTAVSVIHAVVN